MNVYRFVFTATCPANGAEITYSVEIRSKKTIQVEALLAWRTLWDSGFHETFADALLKEFGGAQRITATHHGVQIETLRQ